MSLLNSLSCILLLSPTVGAGLPVGANAACGLGEGEVIGLLELESDSLIEGN